MTSQDQFEAWATEHLPTLYLTKTKQGTYESTATGNFFAVWSARDEEIERLSSENGVLRAGSSRLQGELHAGSDLIATCRRVNREIRSDRDQLKATVADYEMGLEAAKEEIAQLKGEVEGLRRQIPSQEEIWCACGDGYPVNSYGAGFMDANNGVCVNCDAANGGVEPDLDIPDELKALRKDAERYRYMRKCSCEFRSGLPNHDPVLESDYDAECDASMSKGEQP